MDRSLKNHVDRFDFEVLQINLTKDFLAERRVVIVDPQSERRMLENATCRLRLSTSAKASAGQLTPTSFDEEIYLGCCCNC